MIRKNMRAVFFTNLAVLLCLLSFVSVGYSQTFYDNEREFSNSDPTLNIRRSEHFRFIWGNGQNPGTSSEYDLVTEQLVQGNLQAFEHSWHLLFDPPPAGLGFRAPNESLNPAYRDGKFYRANLEFNNTGINSGGGWGAVDDWGFPLFGVNPAGLRYDPSPDASLHEYIHTVLINAGGFNNTPWDGQWHESTDDWLGIFSYWYAGMGNYSVYHNLSLTNGRCYYDSWLFPQLLYEDPRYGVPFINKLWTEAKGYQGEYIFDAMIRLHPAGEPDPTNTIKDLLGQMAARNVTWDYLGKQYYRLTTPYVLNGDPFNDRFRRGTTELIQQPGVPGWYRVPFEHAPCQGGYDIVPIDISDKAAGASGYSVSVDFQPVWDSVRKSDWRATFVAVNTAGDARYSSMWNCGINKITLSPDENKLYLVVSATPDFLPFGGSGGPLMTDAPTAPQPYRVAFVNTTAKPYLAKLTKSGTGYAPHPNGGGMVANSAHVDATAYVGPNALVYDSAKVYGYARIEDYAQVLSTAQVRDYAVVSGHAVVKDQAQVYGNAKVRDWATISNHVQVYDNGKVLEHAWLIGNSKVYGNGVVKGCVLENDAGETLGCGFKDADCSNYCSVSKGVLMGWVWGSNPDRANKVDNNYLYCGYDFDKTSPIYALDKYGITYGFLMGNPQVVNGGATNRGSVLSLNGTDQYVELLSNVSDQKDSTIAAWVKWSGNTDNQKVWSMGDGINKVLYLTPRDATTGKLKFVITDGTTTQSLNGNSALPANTWTHVAVVFSGSTFNTTTRQWFATATLYVNGASVATAANVLVPDQCNGANTAAAGNCNYIGRGNSGDYFSGQIDDFRIYMKALSTSELTALQTLAGGTVATTSDTTAPTPNAATWLVAPKQHAATAVTMAATKGTDASNFVEYYFDCTSGSGHDSGWISNNKYFDSNLTPGGTYTYTVQMRDRAGNLTTASAPATVTLPADDDPPSPNPPTFASVKGISTSAIRMTATKGTDASGMVEYKFTRITPTAKDSGWQTNPTWTDTGLSSTKSYTYKVQMRDAYGNTGPESAVTTALVPKDETPPVRYEYGEWSTYPYATVDNCIAMRARSVRAGEILSLDIAGEAVEYYFHCTSGNGPDSGWVTSNVWKSTPLADGTYSYQFKIRDKSSRLNETEYSSIQTGTVGPTTGYHNYTLDQLSTLPDEYLVSFTGTVVKVNSDNYIVKDLASGNSIMVKSHFAPDKANSLKVVSVKGHLYTLNGTRLVSTATVTATGDPTTYQVSGRVTDTRGIGIAGATVYFSDVANPSAYPIVTATTDASGNYSKGVINGAWYVAAGSTLHNTSADRVVTVSGAAVNNINFSLIGNATVSGRVSKQIDGTPLAGASVYFSRTPNAFLTPVFTATTDANGNYTQPAQDGTWYVCAGAPNYYSCADRTVTIVNQGNISGINLSLVASDRNIPRTEDLLFSAVTDTFPNSGVTGPWATYLPAGQELAVIGSPTVDGHKGAKLEYNAFEEGDGYDLGTYQSSIPINGATIVVAIKPKRSTDKDNWRSIVDIFYRQLVLAIQNDTGKITVRRNGDSKTNAIPIPDGQMTILSLVMQPDGTYQVYANSTSIMNITLQSSMPALIPQGESNHITLGRNWPDAWTTYNGNIGDVFVYKVALSTAERQQLEADLAKKFGIGLSAEYTITTTAGPGGSISPEGAVKVANGATQGFTITPNLGYAVADVKVDNVSVGAVTSYTFPPVTANHTISATFTAVPIYTITASAGAGGTITPSGAISVSGGSDRTFAITANTGYTIADVRVDNVSVGAVASYTFPSVDSNHGIAATFTALPATITGKVTNQATGAALSGATVYLSSSANAAIYPMHTVTTDASGNYSKSVPPGKWYVAAGMTGYTTSDDQTVIVGAAGTGTLNFALTVAPALGTEVFYKFDETSGNTTPDSSGSGKTGSVINNAPRTEGKVGNCMNFNGSSQYVTIPDLGNYAAMTISAWVNLDTLGTDATGSAILACDGSDAGDAQFLILKASGKMRFSLIGNTAADNDSNFAFTSADFGKWRHVAVVYDSVAKTVKFYINGGLNATRSLTTTRSATLSTGVRVGSWSGSRYFDGKIDEFHIYGRALSAAEIAALVNTAPSMRIADAKKLVNGELVTLKDKVVTYAPRTAAGTRATNYFYIEEADRSAGLLVQTSPATSDNLNEDTPATVSGIMRTITYSGQRYLELSAMAGPGTANIVNPLGMTTKSVLTDPSAIGLLVRVAGKVTALSVDEGWFNIQDGYGVDTLVICETGIPLSGFAPGDTVSVTGAIGKDAIFTADAVGIVYMRSVIKL